MLVKFMASLTQSAYAALATKDPGTLYYVADTQRVYKGDVLFSSDVVVLTALPATGITERLYIVNNGTDVSSFIWTGTAFKAVSSTPSGQVLVDVSFNETTKIFTYTYADTTTKTISLANVLANYALLDENGKIPLSMMNDVILGQVLYGGTVTGAGVATLSNNAKTKLGTTSNTITLSNNTTALTGYKANEGIYYIVTNTGSFASLDLQVGDWLISTGASWKKVDNTDAVMSVNGKTGTVVITAAELGAALADHTHALGNGTTPGFSTNDLTNALLAKLNSLTQVTVVNNLTSTSTSAALSAAMGKQLQDNKQNKVTSAAVGQIQTFAAGGDSANSGKTFGGATLPETGSSDKVPTEQAIVDALTWK